MEHFDEVAEIMIKENTELQLILVDQRAWVEGKIKNENWSLGRAASLLMGKDKVWNYATWEK